MLACYPKMVNKELVLMMADHILYIYNKWTTDFICLNDTHKQTNTPEATSAQEHFTLMTSLRSDGVDSSILFVYVRNRYA
jgi:hypothetical protein